MFFDIFKAIRWQLKHLKVLDTTKRIQSKVDLI